MIYFVLDLSAEGEGGMF